MKQLNEIPTDKEIQEILASIEAEYPDSMCFNQCKDPDIKIIDLDEIFPKYDD